MTERLPEDFQIVLRASQAEGIRNMEMLQARWRSGEDRFERLGEALFAAYVDETLSGVGGVSLETGWHLPAMRMRRLYVVPGARRAGVGRALAQACMARGLAFADTLTCNAQASLAAGPFWEALGFVPVEHPNITHVFVRSA